MAASFLEIYRVPFVIYPNVKPRKERIQIYLLLSFFYHLFFFYHYLAVTKIFLRLS